jgi:hypothetical protein
MVDELLPEVPPVLVPVEVEGTLVPPVPDEVEPPCGLLEAEVPAPPPLVAVVLLKDPPAPAALLALDEPPEPPAPLLTLPPAPAPA